MGNTNLKEFVTELGKIPLQYEPGTKWHYSVAVDVQGRLIEALSGMTLGEFLDKRIFQPRESRSAEDPRIEYTTVRFNLTPPPRHGRRRPTIHDFLLFSASLLR